jgi:hypothetical protein
LPFYDKKGAVGELEKLAVHLARRYLGVNRTFVRTKTVLSKLKLDLYNGKLPSWKLNQMTFRFPGPSLLPILKHNQLIQTCVTNYHFPCDFFHRQIIETTRLQIAVINGRKLEHANSTCLLRV